MMRRTMGALCLTMVVAGCGTAAQRQYQNIEIGIKTTAAQGKTCLNAVYSAPEAEPLRAHWPYDPQQATLFQLADTATVNKREIDAIDILHPRIKACQKTILEGLATSMPGLVPIFIKAYSDGDDDLVALLQQKMTWGELTKRRRDRQSAYLASAAEEARRVVAGLQQEHQAELARRQQAAEALAQWAQTQQLLNAATRPVNTTCLSAGPMVNCTTR